MFGYIAAEQFAGSHIRSGESPASRTRNKDSVMQPVDIASLNFLSKAGICWGFFWRGILISLASLFLGGLLGGLLGFVLEEIGPTIYNQAVADVQERLQTRISELDIEIHEEEFDYWRKFDKARHARK